MNLPEPTTETIKLSLIDVNQRFQPRENAASRSLVEEYAEVYRRGDNMEPITVVHDQATKRYKLAGGFHRVVAIALAGKETIEALVYEGDAHLAMMIAVAENRAHGLQRTTKDKQKAIRMALLDSEMVGWSDKKVADHVGVSKNTVAKQREELERTGQIDQLPARTGVDGKKRPTKQKPAETEDVPNEAPKEAEEPNEVPARVIDETPREVVPASLVCPECGCGEMEPVGSSGRGSCCAKCGCVVACEYCGGTTFDEQTTVCLTCRGRGLVEEEQQIEPEFVDCPVPITHDAVGLARFQKQLTSDLGQWPPDWKPQLIKVLQDVIEDLET